MSALVFDGLERICLRCSPHGIDELDLHGSKMPLLQLVFITNLVEILRKTQPIDHVIFQEPQFNDVDVTFLQSLGFAVVEDPEAQLKITNKTALFAPLNSFPLTAECLQISLPALYIGNEVNWLIDATRGRRRFSSTRRQDMRDIFQALDTATLVRQVPAFDWDSGWCRGTSYHWLRKAINDNDSRSSYWEERMKWLEQVSLCIKAAAAVLRFQDKHPYRERQESNFKITYRCKVELR